MFGLAMKQFAPRTHHQKRPITSMRVTKPLSKKALATAKDQVHTQIIAFMDFYQQDILRKLLTDLPNQPLTPACLVEPALSQDSDSEHTTSLPAQAKSNRARLHKIWLAMKPSFKPKIVY